MEIKTVSVDSLANWSRNPREAVDIERLKEILQKRGQLMPLLLDGRDMKTVLGGNMRLRAMKELGWKEVTVSVVTPKDEKDAIEIALEDNDNFGKYVQTQLIELVKEFDVDRRINIEVKPLRIEDIMPQELEAGNIEDDEVPEVKEPISVLGDIYELDGHRVMCGDSTIIDKVQKLMNGKKADMVFTDPPYGVNYTGGQASSGVFIKERRNRIKNDEKLIYDISISNAVVVSKGGAFYVCFSTSLMAETILQLKSAGLEQRAVIAWKKTNTGYGDLNSNYKNNYEPIFYGVIKGKGANWHGDTTQTTTWEFDKPRNNTLHPTMKPVELIEKALNNSSKQEDIILDLFLGSGSTLIACQKTNRICYGMELDPHYVDVIVNRWCEFTGKYDIIRNGEKINWKELQSGTAG